MRKRFEWLVAIILKRKYRIGAEIGCAKGATTQWLLRSCGTLHLYAVDLWAPVPDKVGGGTIYKEWNFSKVKRRFDRAIRSYQHRVTVLQGISWEMAAKVKDGSLDFIFIDADHEYESVIKDIRAWTPKLKDRGMISGHDYNFPDVLIAINELIPQWKDSKVDHVWYARKEDVKL